MHQTVTQLLDRAKSVRGDDAAGQQFAAIQQMGNVLHSEVAAFFVESLATSMQNNLGNMEILRILAFAQIGEATRYTAIGEQILRLIRQGDDELLRTYAVKAAANFSDISGMYQEVAELLLDSSIDIDVRCAAFAFIRLLGATTQSQQVLEQLSDDPEFAIEAAELLSQWSFLPSDQ